MADICTDNRFELIKKYKYKLIEATNIESDEDEMKVIDNILFRCWQMGWLDKLESIDAPVVRCRDCKWCDERITDDGMNIYHWCLMRDGEVPQMDWFCADGERRDNE